MSLRRNILRMGSISQHISDDNNQLLPSTIDLKARVEPDKLFCALLKSANVRDGLTMVTYCDYANAINKCAWWIEKTLGRGNNSKLKTLAYFGPPDIRQTIVALAAAKTSYKTLLVSVRNTVEGQLKLFEATECRILLVAEDLPGLNSLVAALASKRELQIVSVQNLDQWIGQEKVPEYRFHATLENDASRPFVILHTSGSTGFPKPIVYTFGAIATYRTFLRPEKIIPGARPTTVDVWKNKVTYVAFPTFHMVGFMSATTFNVYWGMTPIFSPGTSVANAKLAADIHSLDLCESTILPVSVLEAIAKESEYLEGLRNLRLAIWCGSSWSSSAAPEMIRSRVPIYSGYGATEAGPFMTQVESQDDYEYMSFSPVMGAQFRPYIDGLYEMVIVREYMLEGIQHIFCTFPNLTEWRSKDLFSRHPTKEGLWRYRSRSDDIFVLATGANVNPLLMEGIMTTHPKVSSALLTGANKLQTAWLIEVNEPPQNDNEIIVLIENIWPTVEKANDTTNHAKVSKDKILFAKKDKLMLRSAKGTVQRQATVLAYHQELEALYE